MSTILEGARVPELQGFDERSLALLKRGATLLVTGIGLSFVARTLDRGVMRTLDEGWLNELSATDYAARHAGLAVLSMVCVLIGVLGWRDILRADRRLASSEDRPRRRIVTVLWMTVVVSMITAPLEPFGQYAISYTDWLDHREQEYPDWLSAGFLLFGLAMICGLLVMAVRFLAGVQYLGRLGARVGLPRHPRSARRLLIFSLSLPVALGVTMVAMVFGGDAAVNVGILVIMGLAIAMLVAVYKYASLVNSIRIQAKLALALHRDGTLDLEPTPDAR